MGRGNLVFVVAIGCASSGNTPAPSVPEAATTPEDVSYLPSTQDTVADRRNTEHRSADITIDDFIGCTPVQTSEHAEVCVRESQPCQGLSNCRTVPSAFCFRHDGDELCFSDPAPCFSSIGAAERSGETATGCYVLSSRARVASANATPATTSVPIRTTGASPAAERLMLFGGDDHKVFLGCLCNAYDIDSVFNEYGSYGNRYNSETIWNAYGEFGSAYSSTSACNSYASDPPVVVTGSGTFVGYLTMNQYKPGAITDPDTLGWLKWKVCTR